MISERLSQFLVEQVGHELTAHGDYMGMALYFDRQSLKRWGRFFHDQAIEEAQHAVRIMDFLTDNEVAFDLPALPGATTQFESAAAAAEAARGWERAVTERFRNAASMALQDGDATVYEFLQWFIAEQVEEEAKMAHVIDLIGSGINLFQAEPLLDALGADD
jgi:bacterioferritin B